MKQAKNKSSDQLFKSSDIESLDSRSKLLEFLNKKEVNIQPVLVDIQYEKELELLQIELLKLQNWILKKQKRLVVIFEGRDAAGKGGSIRRFKRYLNPRSMRVVALNKPTSVEKGQWYFRRHVKELPNPGEIVFFDRSWYNRAVVEPVMGFCTKEEYEEFIRQAPEFEHMLYENGVMIIKFWFDISREEQGKRFDSRKEDPLKQWKLSPVDKKARSKWDEYTHYAQEMFSKTHTVFAPWILIRSDDKKTARLESIRYVLSSFEYEGKSATSTLIHPDPNVVQRFSRAHLLGLMNGTDKK